MGGVFVLDSGASPSSGTVTATINGTPPIGIAFIIREFARGSAAASQNGVTNARAGRTPDHFHHAGYRGSQCVVAYGSNNNVQTNTLNGSSTRYGVGQDTTNGSTFEAWEANALSTAGTPISIGFTSAAEPGSSMAAAEICLPAGACGSAAGAGEAASAASHGPRPAAAPGHVRRGLRACLNVTRWSRGPRPGAALSPAAQDGAPNPGFTSVAGLAVAGLSTAGSRFPRLSLTRSRRWLPRRARR